MPIHPRHFRRIDPALRARMFLEHGYGEPFGVSDEQLAARVAGLRSVGDHVHYYAVDHSPSYLWDSATWEISAALLPHLETVLAGPDAWAESQTITRAIEIRDGEIANPSILSFQHRSAQYPHPVG